MQDTIQTLLNEGWAHHQAGRFREAESCYKRVLQMDPAQADALQLTGQIAHRSERADLAIALFRQSLASDRNQPLVWINLGIALRDMQREREAGDAFREACRQVPREARGHFYLGSHYLVMGEKEKAAESLMTALSLFPGYGEAARLLSMLGQAQAGKVEEISRRGLSGMAESDPHALHFHYALGTALDHQGDYEQAFNAFCKANAAQAAVARDTLPELKQLFSAFRDVFPESAKADAEEDPEGPQPVFIVGLPRSGTTLVESILAAHPDVTAGDELPYLKADFPPAVKSLTGYDYPYGISELNSEQWEKLGALYRNRLRALAPAARIMTDKNPMNAEILGLTAAALPEARVIWIERDQRAVAWSVWRNWFGNPDRWYCDMDAFLAYTRALDGIRPLWEKLLGERFMTVRYEDLVEDMDKHVPGLVAHAGLEMHDACLAPHKAERTVRTNSAMAVREPVHARAKDAWRRYEPWLKELAPGLYDTED